VEVVFTKQAHPKHFPPWVVNVGKSRVEGSHLGCRPVDHLPHDVVTFVVERELGITDGFFATVAAGGTFRSMRKRRHAAGKAVIARNRGGLDAAEVIANVHWTEWLHRRPTPCAAALDQALADWRATPPGESLTLTWDVRVPTGSTRHRRRR
jgi:hypothetical protein